MSRMLLAAAALAVAAPLMAQEAHEHGDHDHGTDVHSHRGPGPHFIDAFFVENAYFERKIRPDLMFAGGDAGDIMTAQVEVEWALRPSFGLIVHAPFHAIAPTGGSNESGIGDIAIGSKIGLVNDRRRLIVSTGADFIAPTGDEARGLGEGHWAAAPFLLAWVPFGPERRWLLQGALHADLPLEGSEHGHAETGVALSWTSPLGVTPMLEGIVEIPLDSGEETGTAVAPGFRWEFAEGWEAGASLRLRVSGPREETRRFAVGLIHHFPMPR